MSRIPAQSTMVPPHLDPLTQVLDAMQLRFMLPSAHEMTAPWGLRFGELSSEEICRHAKSVGLPPPPSGRPPIQGAIVAVVRGSACIEVEAHDVKLPLSGGDIALILRPTPVILRDAWQTPVRNVHELIRREHIENLAGLRHGGGGVPTTFLSGAFFSENDEDAQFLSALPPVVCIRAAESDAAPWLESTLKFLSSELSARKPGSQSIVNHLAHVMFVQAVRAYAASLPEDSTGSWFHAIFDSDLAPALGLIHLRPEHPWTVASLAEASNIGRSAFAARFNAAVGRPPLQYLTDYRMQRAKTMLRDTSLGVKTIAAKVGYSNESAFSHAFRRATGASPGRYRRKRGMATSRPASE